MSFNSGTGGDSFSLFVNPASLGGSAPVAASATLTGSNLDFSSVVYNAGATSGTSTIDELRLGTSFASVTPPLGKSAPTLTLTDASGAYTSSAFTATTASIEGVTPTVTYYSGTSATGSGSATAPSTVGTYTVLESFAGSTDYSSGTTSITFSITKATPSVSVSDAGGTSNGATFAASDTVAGVGSQSTAAASLEGVTPTLTYYSGASATGSGTTTAPSALGTYTVLASFAGSTDYTSAGNSTTFTISQPGVGLLAYDGFTGSTGALNGDTDGTGWNTSASAGAVGWFVQNSSTATPGYQVTASSLSYSGLQTSGGSATGGSAYLTAGRRLDTTGAFAAFDAASSTSQIGGNGTTLWFSVLVDRQVAVGSGQTATSIDFTNNAIAWNDSSPEFGVGYYGASSDSSGNGYWSLNVGGTVVKSTTPVTVGTPALLVLEMSFNAGTGGDSFSLFVNPTSLGTSAPATASATETGTAFTFSNVVYNAGNAVGNSSIDELRLGGTFASVTPTAAVPAVQGATTTNVSTATNASTTYPFYNPVTPLDVLGTGGAIVPADALAVIDYLNTHPGGALPTSATTLTQYVDVLGSGVVVPADALAIINYLNTNPVTVAAAPDVTTAATIAAAGDSTAATAAVGDSNSSTGASAAASGNIGAPLALPSDTPTVTPAVVATGPIGAAGSSASPAIQAAVAGTSSTLTPPSPIMAPAVPVSQTASTKQQANIVDALLSDPSEDWLDG